MQSSGTGLKLKKVAFFLAVLISAGMPVFNSALHAEFMLSGFVFTSSGYRVLRLRKTVLRE